MTLSTYLVDQIITAADGTSQRCEIRVHRIPSAVPPSDHPPGTGYPVPLVFIDRWMDEESRTFDAQGQAWNSPVAGPPTLGLRLNMDTLRDAPSWNDWPAHRALLRGEYENALTLAQQEPVDRLHPELGSLLFVAVGLDFSVLVEQLLNAGADPHGPQPDTMRGVSPMNKAVRLNLNDAFNGDRTLRALLSAGGDLFRPDQHGVSALESMQPELPEDQDLGGRARYRTVAAMVQLSVEIEAQRLRDALPAAINVENHADRSATFIVSRRPRL